MRATSFYEYFAFGYNYSLLKQTEGHSREGAIELLERFLTALDDLELPVTKAVAAELFRITKNLKDSEANKVTPEISDAIIKEINKLDPTLDAEMQLRQAFVLTKKRYDVATLLREPLNLLGKGAVNSLSETSERDFKNACRQIALNQPTASAFHLMRTLEAQVKTLYFSFKKTKRLKTPMWGPMTAELRKKNAPKPSIKLLDHLDGMRVHFRNPTQHPDKFYTIDEAQDLLSQTIAAINMIHAELPKGGKTAK